MLRYLVDPIFQVINTAGKPATGGYIEVYVHGTGDKYYCASDFDGTLHPFKIPLDSLGSNIILADDANAYDIYVYNRYGSLLMSRYNIAVSNSGGGGNASRKGTIHKIGLLAVDAADPPPKPNEFWVLDLESPNENEPSGYDRLTVEKAREIHNSGAFFGLRTEHVQNPYEDNLLLETYYDYVSMSQTFEVKLSNISGYNEFVEYKLGNYDDYVGVNMYTTSTLLAQDGNGSDVTVTFSESATRVNISSGEKLSVLFGKIKKWLSSLKALAFKDKADLAQDVSGVLPIANGGTNANTTSGARTNLDVYSKSEVDNALPQATSTTPSMDGTASAGSSTQWSRGDHVHPSDTSREAVSNKAQVVDDLSTTAYPSSKAVADFVNSSIATNTANFLGTLDVVNDLGLSTSATNAQIATALGSYAFSATPTNNDYVFAAIDLYVDTGADEYRRFKFNGTAWAYEYTLNNSSFTAAQWEAINSGLSSIDKTIYDASVSTMNAHVADSTIHVTSTDKTNWNAKQDVISTDTDSSSISDSTTIATGYGSNKIHFNTAARLWSYIQDKISSVLGLTSSAYGGKAATAGTSDYANAAASSSALETALNSKANDSAVVHLAGAETITGVKTFSGNLPIQQNDSTSLKLNKKILIGNAGTNYNSWDSSLKDGNHYRRWRVKLGIDSQEVYYFVVNVYGTYISRNSVGVVSVQYSVLPNYANNTFHANNRCYLPVESLQAAQEFRLSPVFYDDTDGYCIDVVSSTPTSNNPITVVIDVGSKVLKNITLSDVTIIDGWPAWAGDINVAPRLQSNERNVMLAGDNADSATDATYSTKIGSSSSHPAIGSSTQPVYVDSDGSLQPCTLKGVYLSQYNADSLSNIIDAFDSGLLVFSKYAGDVYLLLDADSNGATFVCNTTVDGKTYYSTLTVNSSNVWSQTRDNIFNNIAVRKHYGANHEASVITTATDISNGYVEYALDFTDMFFGGGNSILFISLPNESTLAYYFNACEVMTYPYTTGQNSIDICKFTDLTHDDDGNAIGANDEYTWLRTCNSPNYIQRIKGLKLRCYLNTTSGITWQAGIELKLKLDFNAVRFDKL